MDITTSPLIFLLLCFLIEALVMFGFLAVLGVGIILGNKWSAWISEHEEAKLERLITEASAGNLKSIERLAFRLTNNSDYFGGEMDLRIQEVLIRIGAPSVKPLLKALRARKNRRNIYVARKIVRILGEIGDPEAVGALEQTGDSRDVEALSALLKDPSPDSRIEVIRALGKIGAAVATRHLEEMLTDRDCHVRKAAAQAITSIGWNPIDDTSSVMLAIAIQNWDKAALAGDAAIVPLIAVLDDRDPHVVTGASKALASMGSLNVVKAVIEASERHELIVERILEQIRNEQVTHTLLKALTDENVSRRLVSARVLGKIGNSEAIEPLRLSLTDKNYDVRVAAGLSLGKIGIPSCIPDIDRAISEFEAQMKGIVPTVVQLESRQVDDEDLSWMEFPPSKTEFYEVTVGNPVYFEIMDKINHLKEAKRQIQDRANTAN